ncbi:MAG: hypothetical protein IKN49_03055 [Elusimicrobiaceae bacterium]|nr:hypothetical protein [Elusimicrobiaceae bacterium]
MVQLHCEAKSGDERANRLCEKLLMGQDLKTTDDGYVAYLLDQNIDKATCDGVSRTWSNKQTKCYKTEEDRCEANGMPYKDGVCGYTNVQNATVEEGGVCKGTSVHGCNNAKVYAGASCIGDVVDGCWRAQIYAGGSCIANSFDGCWGATIHDGGKAICNAGGGCQQVVYEGTGCCEGAACPAAHKCAD